MEWGQVAFVGGLVVLGCVLQSAVGFGFGLFTIPLMVWARVPLPSAVAISQTISGCQTVWGWYHTRGHVTWRETMPLLGLRLLTLPLGLWMLGLLVAAGQDRVKQVVGGLLLTVLVAQSALRVQPRQRVAAGWTVLAGTSSGFLAGLVGMGGPPLVLWVMAHDWSVARARVFLWISFLATTPAMLALLWLRFGHSILLATGLAVLLSPAVVVGSTLGLRLGARLSRARLRSAAMIVLLLIAIASIFGPMIGL